MRVYILFVGNIRTCFHALAAGSITIMGECTHVLDVSIESRALYSDATPPPTIVSSVLTTRSWPIRKKRIGTSSLVSDTRHSSEHTFGRRDSLVGCIHLAMTQRYPFCMEEKMKTCRRALTTGSIPIMSYLWECFHVNHESLPASRGDTSRAKFGAFRGPSSYRVMARTICSKSSKNNVVAVRTILWMYGVSFQCFSCDWGMMIWADLVFENIF